MRRYCATNGFGINILDSPIERRHFEIGRSWISNPKSEILDWTPRTARATRQSNWRFRDFGFEIQDLSNFEIGFPGLMPRGYKLSLLRSSIRIREGVGPCLI